MMLMNEEEIRGNLLLPYLKDLGFDPSEISMEDSFTIRLGKTQHPIKGRPDILCTRNGKNLFIIELKNDSITISKDDIDQGISYARALIDNIAPFTIITNGKSTRIFDSISGVELTGKNVSEHSDFWKNGCTLSIDEDLRIRYEALQKFVSFSDENLKLFCRNQVQDRMGTIVGSIEDPTSKFVKELYIHRQELQSAFTNFVNGDASVFGIVGSAGVGKTNTMCSLALQSLENTFVFFYNAGLIHKSISEHIAQDLNLVFSAKNESDLVLKKLNDLGRSLKKDVLLFIDAIDEYVIPNISHELSELALSVRNLDRVKICISCKSNIWKNILITNGTHTHLYEELNKSHGLNGKLDNCPGYLLEDFNDEELKGIVDLYKNTFGFKGEISKTLLKELRNGFFLRIFSEVYRNKQIPDKISDKNLIKAYLSQSLEKTVLKFQPSIRILSQIGKILVQHEYRDSDAYYDDGINAEKLHENLNFSLDQILPEDLFARNILTRSNKEDSCNISFYYSKIRDFIICFHSYKLDHLSNDDFYNIIDVFYSNYIGQSAIEFYILNASETHKQAFIRFKQDKALAYITSYNSYLEENFRNFKEQFDPKTKGDIGIVLPIDLLNNDWYALFPLKTDKTEMIRYENLQGGFWGSNHDQIYKLGIQTLHGGQSSLLVPDQSKVIQKNTFTQLRNIIEKGGLHAYNSDILLREQLALILYYYHKQLGYDFKIEDLYMPRYELIYPIDLHDLRCRIFRFRAKHHYEKNNTPASIVNRMVDAAVETRVEIPNLNVGGDFPPFEELFKIVNILLNRGYGIIDKHHLPLPDRSIAEAKQFCKENNCLYNIPEIRNAQFSLQQARFYVECFVQHLEECYKEFVDHLFPTFKDRFSFYNSLPLEYFFYINESGTQLGGMIGYRTLEDGRTKFHFKGPASWENMLKEDEISSGRGFSLDSFIHSDYFRPIRTIDGINTSKVDDFCVIRSWVYKLLKSDIRELFKDNGEYI